ncbi:ATP-binding protein [Bacillus mycoides]|uniref:ATP-binding protein n=1 Tax=Bacillus mycoides TaxID=1405 RepID=UPI003CFED4D5
MYKEEKGIYTDRPIIPPKSHPIYTGRYLLATNEITNLYDTITRWIDCRSPGGIVYGRPRIGKTRALKFLMSQLPLEYGNDLPIYIINCRHYKIPNENLFFEDLLRDIGHAFPFNGKANIKRERLTKFLVERGLSSKENRVIFIMDDAQELHEMHFKWLMDIYNELDRANIQLTVVLVGQKELLSQKSAFIAMKKAQIIGRFMVHEHEFKGICSTEDLHTCLIGYDEESIYPIDSSYTFTQFFFPELFQDGFRLTDYTKDFYELFQEVRREANIPGKFEIPMQFLTTTIEFLLIQYGVDGKNVQTLSKTHIMDSIQFSGYVRAEVYSKLD